MKHKIFANIFIGVMIIFVLCFPLSMWGIYQYYSSQSLDDLKTFTGYISEAIEKNGYGFLTDITKDDSVRITYISKNGEVIYDSYADEGLMSNHMDRDEIIGALKDGEAKNVRYSNTTNSYALNYAVRLSDDSVLRISSKKNTSFSLIGNMTYYMLFFVFFAAVLAVFLAKKVSDNIIKPINDINLENPDVRDVYSELIPLIERIKAQNLQIHNQMNEIKQEHEKQNRMRKEFTANVSHELKTPLTSISGYAEIMRDGFVKSEDICRFSGKIYDETQRLITLVGDIINLSRLDEEEGMGKKTDIDLYNIASSVVNHLESTAKKRGISIMLNGSHQIIKGVEQIVEEIIYNLCDNAIKYNKENGGIIIDISNNDGYAQITVSDTGIGIPDEDIDRVFERFYRVDKSHSKEIGGTGLGLSIVKHGVSYHGGEISINSTVGVGTEIKIVFKNI